MTDRLGKITASQPLPDPKARAVVQRSGGEREVKGKVVPAFWTRFSPAHSAFGGEKDVYGSKRSSQLGAVWAARSARQGEHRNQGLWARVP